ncbi:hypothetical protein B566_EDAN007729 [Ephemera danica]|nr:hypothetical protein B566_EDAN007729 [Ephemera danica]
MLQRLINIRVRSAMNLILGLSLTLSIYLISGTHALACYDCPYDNPDCAAVEPQCADASPYYIKSIQNAYFPEDKTDYDDPKNLPKPVCYTEKKEDKNGETKVSRKCSSLGSKLTCDVIKAEAKNEQSKLISCDTCSKDFCNSAAIATSMSSAATIFLLVSVTFLFVSL